MVKDGILREKFYGKTINKSEHFETALFRMVLALKELHKLRAIGFGRLNGSLSGEERSWKIYVLTNIESHLYYCKRHGLITPADAKTILLKLTLGDSKYAYNELGSILHGDPSGENAALDTNGFLWLFDFEEVLSGDPLYEVAFVATFHPEHLSKILKWFEREESELFWLYYLRISVMKLVALHKKGVTNFNKGKVRIQQALGKLC
jgi:aminoglycoside phosphotransferase (APT) family kinase protein